MMLRRRAFRAFTFVAALLCTLHAANASLMAYEGLVYPAGDSLASSSTQGESGSFGWGGPWVGSKATNATNYPTNEYEIRNL